MRTVAEPGSGNDSSGGGGLNTIDEDAPLPLESESENATVNVKREDTNGIKYSFGSGGSDDAFLAKVISKHRYNDMNYISAHYYVGDFSVSQAFKAFYIHALFLLLGSPISSIFVVPIVGLKVALKRKFLVTCRDLKGRMGRNILSHSYALPLSFAIYCYRDLLSGIYNWCDLYLTTFPVVMYLAYMTLKYGLTEEMEFKVLFQGHKSPFGSKLAPMLLQTGMLGRTPNSMDVYISQFERAVEGIPAVKADIFTMTVGLVKERNCPSVVIHNSATPLTSRPRAVSNPAEALSVRKVNSNSLGLAILRGFDMSRGLKVSLYNKVHHAADAVSALYAATRLVGMLLMPETMSPKWYEWVSFCVLMFIKLNVLRQWFHHCALPYALFSKLLYFEMRMGRVIHQLHVNRVRDVVAWQRLRFALRKSDDETLKYCVVYSAASLTGSIFFTFLLATTAMMDTGATLLYVLLVLVHVYVAQGLVLYALRTGASVNYHTSRHIEEWLKVSSSIIVRTNDLNLSLKNVAPENLEEEKDRIVELESTVREIDVLCKQLKNEIDFGGLRFASLRMTKVVFKSMFLLYMYQIYYSAVWFVDRDGASNYFFVA
jgi:hypothetical protein